MTTRDLVIFTFGAAVGFTVAYRFAVEKFKKIADEEIASVKEAFSKREKKEKDVLEEVEKKAVQEAIVRTMNYKADKEGGEMTKPYVISPEEFGEENEYDTQSLTYYSDGVLTDEDGNIIYDIDIIVGTDFANHFGEYEDDSVFIRNDNFKVDYEILKDYRNYSEAS